MKRLNILFLTFLLTVFCVVFPTYAENVMREEDTEFIVTLDNEFWQNAKAIHNSPEVIIKKGNINPGELICYYKSDLHTYAYRFHSIIKNRYILVKRFNSIENVDQKHLDTAKYGTLMTYKIGKFNKYATLKIQDVTIKLRPVKDMPYIIADPNEPKSLFSLIF